MKLSKITGLFGAIILTFIASVGYTTQTLQWTYTEPGSSESIEDMTILKKVAPAGAADPNDRLALVLTSQSSGSTPINSTKIRILNAGTGAVLNETQVCSPCVAVSIQPAGYFDADRMDDIIVRARFGGGANWTDTAYFYDADQLNLLGQELTFQTESIDYVNHPLVKVLTGDFDKDGKTNDVIDIRKKGVQLPDVINAWKITP